MATDGLVALHIELSVSLKEISDWSPERTTRFFNGIAAAMSAANEGNTAEAKIIAMMPQFDPTAPQEIRDHWWRMWNGILDEALKKRADEDR